MKKLMIITAAASLAIGAFAQQPTVESGIKLYNYKKYNSAQKALTPLSVKDAKANYYLGLAYLDAGSATKANYQFQKYPDDPANISGTAMVAFASKDAAKGMQIAKDLAAKAKKKEFMPMLYAAKALTYSDGADLQQAIQWYKDVLTKDPNNVEAHLGLGDTYRKMTGGGGEAMNNYEAITEKDAKNSLVLSRIGDLWYEARNYSSAVEFYDKAKNADSTNPLPYYSLSQAYWRSGQFDKSLTNIRKYISISDNTISDQVNFVEILYLAKANCEAAKLAQELMTQEVPADKKISLTGILGFAQADCGDSIEAQKNLKQYFALQKPKAITPGAYIEYGKLWLKLNNLDSASFYYLKGIEGDTAKNKTDIYRQIAEAYRMKKEYCRSGEWYDNLIKSNPATQPLDHFWCVVMYYYCKDWKSAIPAAQRFEEKYPDQASSTYWRARVLAAVDSEAATGAAEPYFASWIEKIGAEADKKEKKADVTKAYQYLLLYNYNKKDKEKTKLYMDKLRSVDANDGLLKQIEDVEKSPAAPAPKKDGVKTKPPVKK
ncbi:MAG: tetratricopeptide repeat protein [Taibaiella sp.]|nr:tetratricopeptide repeat protein [Taibaiella sp.]